MSKLYGDIYSRGWSSRGSGTKRKQGVKKFRHKIKPFKVGVRVQSLKLLEDSMTELLSKYATKRNTQIKYSES